MCTLSFVPREGGFLLAMNRDEQRTRPKAFQPAIHRHGNLDALYPNEQGGGTWIGINETGFCAALINWYSRPQLRGQPIFSRGEIIPRLLTLASMKEVESLLNMLPLGKLNPFRLFVIGGQGQGIREYRCDATGMERMEYSWTTQHWFSSGQDEASATARRSTLCSKAAKEPDAGTLPWLTRLHSSHDPQKGADSICMHRVDAVTVSLTLLEVTASSASMRYHCGPPCRSLSDEGDFSRLTINRAF